MQLKEGTHYRRRLDQPSANTARCKEFVDCMFCGCPSDSPDDKRLEKLKRKQIIDGIRLDHLRDHYMKKHKHDLPSEGKSLLDMGFTRAGGSGAAGLSTYAEIEIEESASLRLNMEQPEESVAIHTEQRPLGPAA